MLFGRALEESDGGRVSSFIEFIHPDDQPRMRAVAERCVRESTPFFEEFRYLRPDGSEMCLVGRGRLVHGEGGAPSRMMGAIVDVSERRRVEDALVASEERFRQLAESIHEVFWMTSVDKGQIIYASPAYEAIWGRPVSSLYESPSEWLDAVHPDDRARVWQAALGKQAAGTYDEQYRIVRPDGEVRWIRDHAFPVRDERGAVIRIAGVAEDVTARRDLERQIHESQKMESIGVLAGGVAHDFNNLLTVISGNTELLSMEIEEGSEASHLAQQVSEAAARAANLTRQLLAFSRREVLEPRVLDVNQVVRDLQRMLGRLLGEDIALTANLGSGLGHVFVDPGHLEQVIMNLAVNARDAMPQGGDLVIETRRVAAGGAPAAGGERPRGSHFVQIRVRDTGHGMSPEVRARIFEPFFTTKGRGRGTGLGLAVVHGIVAQSGGCVDVESAPGKGTTFTIDFPEVHDSITVRDGGAMDAQSQRGTETVLVVEDDPSVRKVAERMLTRQGYRVVLAESGEAALALVRDERSAFDLIITDVVMPGMDGGQLASRLREEFPGVKVLFTSGFTDDAVVRHGVYQSEVPFLQKPYTPTSLATKVREVLSGP
ncbi:MAG: PAS domain-containing protein [Deltaproteobacteria bacterium]|nr:PAS domain-containing protein [Deltaproteobacteria bacterium]